MKQVIGNGVYTIEEAAHLARVPAARLRSWFNVGRGAFVSDYAPMEANGQSRHAISFYDLIDAKVASELRASGISMQHVRAAYRALEAEYGEHPFCHKDLRHDRKRLFLKEFNRYSDAITRQYVSEHIYEPFLKQLEYDPVTALALRWHIAEGITIDPAVAFGKPVVAGAGVSTWVLAQALRANQGDAELVASWYEVTPEQVRDAAAFEDRLAKAA